MKNDNNLKRLKNEYCAEFADVSQYDNIYGGSIIEYMESTVGKIANLDKPHYLTHKDEIRAYECEINGNEEYKLLFTVGLFAYKMRECIICLPKGWEIKKYGGDKYYLPDTFPLDVLRAITASVIKKNSRFDINEYAFLDKTKKPWSNFEWPDGVIGLAFINFYWTGKIGDEVGEDEVTIFTICPVFESKETLTYEWYQDNRFGEWSNFAFPFNDKITLDNMMHKAIEHENLDEIKAAVDAGASVNGARFYNHHQCGLCMTDTYFTKILDYENGLNIFKIKDKKFDTIKYMVEQSAEIPNDVLARIAWLGTDVTDYFVEKGFDINALDCVGYTALNRAEESRNFVVKQKADKKVIDYYEDVCEHIKSLGGVFAENLTKK